MSSAVSELTGGESNTTELDEVMAERKVNEINRKPVDYSDTAGKFAMLDIGKPLCRLTDGGNVEVYVDIFLKSVPVPQIFGTVCIGISARKKRGREL